ncbi:Methyltransferase domain-containing protein [Desulfocicer vacuolatum DSM 3385]|uniref:Methyltransferase domain-containing protein n=1 Tax=Desulfocicer vacuolatum DSM 3385 TaxID=1121400 RepID=A0A1W1Z6M0_9BACT|nr:class I SAM-dependent methyltransferase [Desulfocicer vacuolatum]SMC43578.1 Methyltransferase domain-containing protein [Desulfocicer vacuolatum DSM 3385]
MYDTIKKNKKINISSTAYIGDGAYTYDDRRFKSKQGRVFHNLELTQLKKTIQIISKNSYVLEVGCGTARFSEFFAKQGFKVRAIDPSPDMIKIAQQKCASLTNVDFQVAEGASLPFENDSFDFVFAIRVLNSTESKDYAISTISEMIRVAKKEGVILVEFANRSRPFVRNTTSVRLTFNQIKNYARSNNCSVIKESGILIFSQTVLNKIPLFFLGFWEWVEKLSAIFIWRFASRGYIIIKKG